MGNYTNDTSQNRNNTRGERHGYVKLQAPPVITNVREKKVFFGVKFNLTNYKIEGRAMDLALPTMDYEEIISRHRSQANSNINDNFTSHEVYKNYNSNYQPMNSNNQAYQCKALQMDRSGPDVTTSNAITRYDCDVLHDKNIIYQENSQEFKRTGSVSNPFTIDNDFLKKAIGICVKRNKTFKNEHNGFFRMSDVEENGFTPLPTENLAMKIYFFIKMKLGNNQIKLYELKDDGSISENDVETEYNRRKKMIYENEHALLPNERAKYSIKAGLQQFYVLAEQDSTHADRFILKEVYCDGEQVF